MHKSILLIALVGIASAHSFDSSEERPHGRFSGMWRRGPFRGGFGGGRGRMTIIRGPHPMLPPPPPFLKNVSEEARKEFFVIVRNENSTKAEIKQGVEEWASKQPQEIQEQVKDFHRNITSMKEEVRQNATSVILQLQTAFDRFTAILNDDSLTNKETFEKMKNAAKAFDRDVNGAVKMIMHGAFRRILPKYLPHQKRPFGGPDGMTFPPPPPPTGPEGGNGFPFPPPSPTPEGHGFPFPPPPPPPTEGDFDPFFPPARPDGPVDVMVKGDGGFADYML